MADDQRLKSFFAKMKRSEENIQAGFKLLEEQKDLLGLFSRVVAEGFYDTKTFKPPLSTGKNDGSFWVPPHPGMRFLELVAKQAAQADDANTINAIIKIIKDVSAVTVEGSNQLDNYHVWRSFLEITTVIPTKFYDGDLIRLIRTWIFSRYDRSLVVADLPKLAIKLLNGEEEQHRKWACDILEFVTDFGVLKKETGNEKINGLVESYWLREFVKKTAELYGAAAGRSASLIMLQQLIKVQAVGRLSPSHWTRSAIERHKQNLNRESHEHILINATRDILYAWFKVDAQSTQEFYADLIAAKNALFQRFALFLATEFPPRFDESVFAHLEQFLSDPEYHHEVYRYLQLRFGDFSKLQKKRVLEVIEALKPGDSSHSDRYLVRSKLTWLSAIFGKGLAQADELKVFLENQNPDVKLTKNPDFLTYFESRWGPGPSEISASQIVDLVKEGNLVKTLNAYKAPPSGLFDKPTLEGLALVLRETIKEQPNIFLEIIDDFLEAKPAFQYEFVYAFLELRRKAEFPKDGETWEAYWPKLIPFLHTVLTSEAFWNKDAHDDESHRDDVLGAPKSWIPGVATDLLELGLNRDEQPLPEGLMPLVEEIILKTLKNAKVVDKESDDQLTHAINGTKGKAFEATIALVLNRARNSKADEGKAVVWEKFRPIFDGELEKCRNANLDVGALFGQYISHFMYLSEAWIERNIARIFPKDHPKSFRSALSGLTYSQGSSRKIYRLLSGIGAIEAAIADQTLMPATRENIFQRLALGLLWGDEPFDGRPLTVAMAQDMVDELAGMVNFIARIHDEDVLADVEQRVFSLWKFLDDWARKDAKRKAVRGALIGLIDYVDDLNDEVAGLVLAEVESLDTPYDTIELAKELARLFPVNRDHVVRIFGALVKRQKIHYDYEGRVAQLIKAISASHPKEAMSFAMSLRHLSGMEDVVNSIMKRG